MAFVPWAYRLAPAARFRAPTIKPAAYHSLAGRRKGSPPCVRENGDVPRVRLNGMLVADHELSGARHLPS